VRSATRSYAMQQPRNGWAEQDPEDWWTAAKETIQEVLRESGASPSDVRGIGLSGQMHGLVALDAEDRVLRPAILWCDQRTAAECEELTRTTGAARLVEITANPALTGFTASKILWMRNHEPALFAQVRRILLPKDYLRLRLTGEYATDVSDASGMQLLDVARRAFSAEMLGHVGVAPSWLGHLYESCEVSGRITAEASRATGLAVGTPVAAGAGDQAAGAVGNGIVREGLVSSTIGTSGVVFAHLDRMAVDPGGRVHTFCHAVPGAWHVMGVTQAAGLSLQWFRDHFCDAEKTEAERLGIDPYAIMDREAADVPPGADGLLYLPYLMGERTPHLDPFCRGVFFGISARHGRPEFIRAVMEGVGYSLMDCMDLLRGMGVPVNEVRASGGGGKSSLWRAMQADMFGTAVSTLASSEGPALGAAILGGVAGGMYPDVRSACDAVVSVRSRQEPDPATGETYRKRHAIYRSLYASLKDDFRRLAE
jgi:xylulokinase